jgi:hypothetical protein
VLSFLFLSLALFAVGRFTLLKEDPGARDCRWDFRVLAGALQQERERLAPVTALRTTAAVAAFEVRVGEYCG